MRTNRVCSRIYVKSLSWLCLGLLSLSVGCTTPGVSRHSPTQSLLPFSESGDTIQPDRWWTEFDDSGLDYQVELALGENFDLAAAMQRLRAARALVRREASDLFPDLDGVISTDTTFGPGPNQTRINWGLDASYQVDLWGQIQSRVDAERFRADATQSDYHAVALSLAAEVTRTWYSLVEAHAQLELLEVQLETNLAGLKAQELRFGIGDEGGGPDVLRQRQLVQSTLEQVVVVRASVEVLEHQLAVLTGQLPQAATYNPGSMLPELPPAPYTGTPSELLMRRPDVRAAYLDYVAADRDVASAISARYPRLNVTGSLINSATSSDNLFRDWFLSIGSQLIAPLFDGGQRVAEIDRTSAVASQRYNEYGQTMLIAFQEVEDSLALEQYQIQRIKRLDAQVELAEQAAEQLRQRFIIGTASYLDFLSATQSQQRLQREILSARLDLVLIRVGLHLAIAGGFDTCPQPVDVDSSYDHALETDTTELSDLAPTNQAQTDEALSEPDLPDQPIQRLPPDPALDIDE